MVGGNRGSISASSFPTFRSSYIPKETTELPSRLMNLQRAILEQREAAGWKVETESRTVGTTCHPHQEEADRSLKLNNHQSKKQNKWITLKSELVKMQKKMQKTSGISSFLLAWGHTYPHTKKEENMILVILRRDAKHLCANTYWRYWVHLSFLDWIKSNSFPWYPVEEQISY